MSFAPIKMGEHRKHEDCGKTDYNRDIYSEFKYLMKSDKFDLLA